MDASSFAPPIQAFESRLRRGLSNFWHTTLGSRLRRGDQRIVILSEAKDLV